jgi:hypothetical protein
MSSEHPPPVRPSLPSACMARCPISTPRMHILNSLPLRAHVLNCGAHMSFQCEVRCPVGRCDCRMKEYFCTLTPRLDATLPRIDSVAPKTQPMLKGWRAGRRDARGSVHVRVAARRLRSRVRGSMRVSRR